MNGRKVRTITKDNDLLDRFEAGVKAVADPVTSTMGPSGKTVIYEKEWGIPGITKDGVTVAETVFLDDGDENTAAQLLKSVAIQQQSDGTTTATCLASSIFSAAAESVRGYDEVFTPSWIGRIFGKRPWTSHVQGMNPANVRADIEKTVAEALVEVRKISVPATKEDLQKVARVSANDAVLGDVVYNAIKDDPSKLVTIESADGKDSSVERVEGAKIPNGFISHAFVTDPQKYECVMDDALIAFIDGKVTRQDDVLALAQLAGKNGNPLLVIAENVEDQALAFLVNNVLVKGFRFCAVKFAAFGTHKAEILSDLAVICGGRHFGAGFADLAKPQLSDLGTAKRVTVSADKTVIVGGNGDKAAIATRVAEVKAQLENFESKYDQDRLKERLSRLTGGVTIVKVGGSTESEIEEKKQRIEDALQATQAAAEEGVLPGGGTALAFVSKALELNGNSSGGRNAVITALRAPMKKILENAGWDEEAIIGAVALAEVGLGTGFSINTGEVRNFLTDGILDATKVVTTALANAGSIAALLIGSSHCITFKAKGDPKEAADAVL